MTPVLGKTLSETALTELSEKLGHEFADAALLKRALTHASASAETSNERLEFLGDRVLGLIVADKLHADFPQDAEGVLALKFNALARREACVRAAEAAGLAPYLILASAEAGSGGRQKGAILAGACEAVIAALYLDGGYEAARKFVMRYWEAMFAGLGEEMRDPKTLLQEWAQGRKGGAAPSYTLVSREGPDHAPRFVVEARVSPNDAAKGEGNSKREAEQQAARMLLERLKS